jgi:tRNA(fMet)-specific endonuclease VapC
VALILDANALSAAADQAPSIIQVLAGAIELAIPVPALGEQRYGISLSRYQSRYSSWLDGLLRDTRVLEIDEETTSAYAEIRVERRRLGRPIPTNDLWIAALCRQHAMALLSRDEHFDVVPGMKRLSW